MFLFENIISIHYYVAYRDVVFFSGDAMFIISPSVDEPKCLPRQVHPVKTTWIALFGHEDGFDWVTISSRKFECTWPIVRLDPTWRQIKQQEWMVNFIVIC